MKIEKKVLSQYFEKILDGSKKYELRLADWKCEIGDILILREIDESRNYTGRILEKEVTYVLKTKDINLFTPEEVEKYGYQVIGFD
ncbi:MAG: hypothetical protein US63_C0026G0013 [Candidatus Moranbacteria bacterium GW2011_GWC2_37_8]|nr:MAG: hypothetical protein US63_C0026G0013 [Candidatus Moranbacteria bacterium GW2011_GWC2_37_8]KKQ62896.1 MAG: PUA domain-like protein [Parcubacteria group bacterium GW2011_GWC1_38_22]KKQ81474.1 MAG: hypothetical protein UT03_C0001G0014 [Candidatus Moranbacteria bacterium GW2011_GWD2_38_7]